nr:YsnF/AvaK domain-containing protein [Chloroflexota bacterium]
AVAMAPAETIVETGNDVRVPVFEEELLVRKRDEEVGRVRIHKEILTEQQTVSAPVTHEEVYVQRVPAQGRYTGVATDAFTESDVVITVMGEELIVGKHAMVTEEVRVHKDMTTEQQDITDTVRHERVYVEGVEESQRTNSNQR